MMMMIMKKNEKEKEKEVKEMDRSRGGRKKCIKFRTMLNTLGKME